MTVDLRHENSIELQRMDSAFRAVVGAVAQENKLDSEIDLSVESAPIPFHPMLVGFVRDAAEALGLSHRDIVSGAGHDAFHMARQVPTAMIFIPCENGISHNESENAPSPIARRGAMCCCRQRFGQPMKRATLNERKSIIPASRCIGDAALCRHCHIHAHGAP